GRVAGKIVTALYFLYFLHDSTVNLLEATSFTMSYLLKGDPVALVVLLISLVVVYCTKKGLLALGRCVLAVVIVLLSLSAIDFAQALPQMKLENIRPIMTQDVSIYTRAANICAQLFYSESIILLVLTGRVTANVKFTRSLVIIIGFAVGYTSLLLLRETLLLGPLVELARIPSFEAARMIGTATMTVSRTENLYALVMMLCSAYRVLLSFIASLAALKSILNLPSYKNLIVPLSLFETMYSLLAFHSPHDAFYYGIIAAPQVWMIWTLLIPLATLIGAAIRHNKLKPLRDAVQNPSAITQGNTA
ncbi:MAG: GerAB/ArcD/ProY family transporter, partial [Oscillospiraceae bacterium]|nr:GerAB/ArcD/ProY family transporter [Oscillospiraceae bacterium]